MVFQDYRKNIYILGLVCLRDNQSYSYIKIEYVIISWEYKLSTMNKNKAILFVVPAACSGTGGITTVTHVIARQIEQLGDNRQKLCINGKANMN